MKYFLLLLLGTIFSLQTFSQDYKFEIGVQGGPSITRIRYLNGATDFFKSRVAFSGGLFFQYNINKIFSLRTDPGFERKGYSLNTTFTDQNGNPTANKAKGHSNFDYITLPILLRASIGNKIKYFINAGPYIGFLLQEKNVVKLTNFDKNIYNSTSSYRTTDIGITTGIGLAIPVKDKFALSVEARNNFGLMNIGKSSNSNDKTISFNLLIGFAYKFGSK